jgi:ABC-2 type transport system permease protein
MKSLNALITIAARDVLKLYRDRMRILASLIFPLIFIGILGGSLDASLSKDVGYNFMVFVFTGVIGQTLFQSTASGIISLIEDRQNDFAQEMFVAPISRYIIILGKICGESLVALAQLAGIFLLGFIFRIPFSMPQLLSLIPAIIICCLLGGAFGTMIIANLGNQRQANQIFQFIIFPQIFLSGVFTPMKNPPLILFVLSRLNPMMYAVDLVRSFYYWGQPEYDKVVLHSPAYNLTVISIIFVIMLVVGTALFTRNERNR